MRKLLRVWAFVGTQFIVSAPAIAQAPDTLWTRTYGGTDWDEGCSVQECAGGGFIIAGVTGAFGGDYDVYLIRTNADGDTLWTKTYGETGDDWGCSVQECAGGGFVIAGVTYSFGAGSYDVYLIRTDSEGDTLWTKTCGGTGGDYGESVQECAEGGFIIAGRTKSFGAGSYDVYLIRISEIGVEETEVRCQKSDVRLEVYPNPSFGNAVIKYGLPEKANVSLRLYDISGRMVKTLYSGAQEKGYHTINVGTYCNMPTGIYFIRFETNDYKATRKLTIMR